jgi:geranylgeranyl diphosphate synthase type I
MSQASDDQARLLRRYLGDRSLTDDHLAALREVIVSTGSLEQVEQRIALRADEARKALRTDAINDEAKAALDALVTAATERHT